MQKINWAIFLLVFLASCGSKDSVERAPAPNIDEAVEELIPQIGIKSASQVMNAMSALTGINQESEDEFNQIEDTYSEGRIKMPADNNIQSFSANTQMAYTSLASKYCEKLVTNNTVREQIWDPATLNFGQPPTIALGTSQRSYMIEQLLQNFWGASDLNDASRLQQARDELLSLVDFLIEGEPNNSTTTRNVTLGACTAVLASAPAMML